MEEDGRSRKNSIQNQVQYKNIVRAGGNLGELILQDFLVEKKQGNLFFI